MQPLTPAALSCPPLILSLPALAHPPPTSAGLSGPLVPQRPAACCHAPLRPELGRGGVRAPGRWVLGSTHPLLSVSAGRLRPLWEQQNPEI